MRRALETSLQANDEVTQCILDAGLRAKAFTKEELVAENKRMNQWPFSHPLGAAPHTLIRCRDRSASRDACGCSVSEVCRAPNCSDYGFVRFVWEDLDSPRRTLARVESRMRIAG